MRAAIIIALALLDGCGIKPDVETSKLEQCF